MNYFRYNKIKETQLVGSHVGQCVIHCCVRLHTEIRSEHCGVYLCATQKKNTTTETDVDVEY